MNFSTLIKITIVSVSLGGCVTDGGQPSASTLAADDSGITLLIPKDADCGEVLSAVRNHLRPLSLSETYRSDKKGSQSYLFKESPWFSEGRIRFTVVYMPYDALAAETAARQLRGQLSTCIWRKTGAYLNSAYFIVVEAP